MLPHQHVDVFRTVAASLDDVSKMCTGGKLLCSSRSCSISRTPRLMVASMQRGTWRSLVAGVQAPNADGEPKPKKRKLSKGAAAAAALSPKAGRAVKTSRAARPAPDIEEDETPALVKCAAAASCHGTMCCRAWQRPFGPNVEWLDCHPHLLRLLHCTWQDQGIKLRLTLPGCTIYNTFVAPMCIARRHCPG